MVHLTVGLGLFFVMLIQQIVRAAATIGLWLVGAALIVLLLAFAARALMRKRRAP